jgi:hypothetical protein
MRGSEMSEENKIEEIDIIIENIAHNKMLVRNWERLKYIMTKKEQKEKSQNSIKEKECHV